jgi:nucleoside-diphosphate-sugar epimerase
MRVLVAGASGAIGRQLLPLLDATGHEVTALVHRTPVRVANGRSVTADALDRESVSMAVAEFEPEVMVNLLTAIPHRMDPRKFTEQIALTNRLRTEGVANLAAAGPGVRLISEGLAFAYAPQGGALADESRPLWARGPKPFRPAVRALAECERVTAESGGLVLRFGHLYGPGTGFAPDGGITERVRAGKMPIVGDGSGTFSFTHAHDAATAIVAALDKPERRGAVNVVDDTPLTTSRWLPAFAAVVGGPAPPRVPAWIARIAVGSWGVAYMNGLVGADNARARHDLDWRPRYGRVQDGWASDFRAAPEAAAR